MRLVEFPLLTDENIDVDVVRFLRQQGFDVRDVCDEGLQGATDIHLMTFMTTVQNIVGRSPQPQIWQQLQQEYGHGQ